MDIYHKRQQSNFCALHAVNALLQEPVYTFNDLIAIAKILDEQEMSLLGDTHYFRSQNMDNNGSFSIQLMEKALAPCGLQLMPFHSSYPRAIAARQNTSNEQAYLCHRNNHWFAYRKIGDTWYDLNSLLSCPQKIKVEGTQLNPFATPNLLNSFTGLFIVDCNLPQRSDPGNQNVPIQEDEFQNLGDQVKPFVTSENVNKHKMRKSTFGRKTYIAKKSAKTRKQETQEQREKRLFDMKGHNLKKRQFETKEEAIARRSVNAMRLSVKRKYKSEEDDIVKSHAKRRATESDFKLFNSTR